ncbi:MAG: biotin--[acetyl-CoA-carboxylase] ligase [Phycisphaerales bacterium]|nr:MAG: hypothetical protein IPK69_00450 [Phycisphaerales bacterium]
MNSSGPQEPAVSTWAGELGEWLAMSGVGVVDRVVCEEEIDSTQDEARNAAGGTAGLVLAAGRQRRGRGRLGRVWADTGGMGLACTFVLDGGMDDARVSMVAGLAACMTAEGALESGVLGIDADRVGMRWPNDVVERAGLAGRKVAGVLVERVDGLLYVGIGINVTHLLSDWDERLRHKAVSLRQLGASCDRLVVLRALIGAVDRAVKMDEAALLGAWRQRDVLVGRRQAFVHDNREYRGTVRGINPRGEIELVTEDGVVGLPALTTSIVHE